MTSVTELRQLLDADISKPGSEPRRLTAYEGSDGNGAYPAWSPDHPGGSDGITRPSFVRDLMKRWIGWLDERVK